MLRKIAQVIGQIGANAKGQLAAAAKLLVQLDRAGNGQAVTEDQRFCFRVHTVFGVMRQHALTPLKRIAAVVPRAIKQLAKVQVKVAQKSTHAVHIRQRNAQVAAVFLGPGVKAKHLAVAQTRAQRLTGLQVLMRHGAQRRQAELHGEQHVAGAGKLACGADAQPGHQRPQHFLMPHLAKTPARAVVRNFQILQAGRLQLANFGRQALPAHGQIGMLLRVAKVHLVDDGKHRNFKQNRVQPGPGDEHLQLARRQRCHGDVLFVQPEQRQKINKIAFDEAHRFQVGQLCVLKTQTAQAANFLADFMGKGCQVANTFGMGVAAFEAVLNLSPRKLVKHHLHHRELVQVRVKQAGDDHRHICHFMVRAKGVVALDRENPGPVFPFGRHRHALRGNPVLCALQTWLVSPNS